MPRLARYANYFLPLNEHDSRSHTKPHETSPYVRVISWIVLFDLRKAGLRLGLRHLESRHESFRVMCEADAVHAIGRLELAGSYQRRLVIARDNFVVDRAL